LVTTKVRADFKAGFAPPAAVACANTGVDTGFCVFGQTKIMVALDEMMDGAVLPQKNATAQLDKSLMDAGYELSDCCSTITAAILNFNDTVTPNSPTFLSKVKPIR
jgi:hypothetical protein